MHLQKKLEVSELELLSAEHHQVLRFCDNIRSGLRKKVEMARIRRYTDWFKESYLEPHFEIEEQSIFPFLGSNVRVKRALANHRHIRKLLSCDCDNEKVLNLLEEELSTYIRFEERVLFTEFKKEATSGNLSCPEIQMENINFCEEKWEDKFWLS